MKGSLFIPGLKVVLTSAVLVGIADAGPVQINVTGVGITRTLVGPPDYYRPINQTGTITLKLRTAGKMVCISFGEIRQDILPVVLAVDIYGRPTKLKAYLRHWLNCEGLKENSQERSLIYTQDEAITEPDWRSPVDPYSTYGLPCVASITETSEILGGDREWEGASGQIVSVGTINNCSVAALAGSNYQVENTFTIKGTITVNKP